MKETNIWEQSQWKKVCVCVSLCVCFSVCFSVFYHRSGLHMFIASLVIKHGNVVNIYIYSTSSAIRHLLGDLIDQHLQPGAHKRGHGGRPMAIKWIKNRFTKLDCSILLSQKYKTGLLMETCWGFSWVLGSDPNKKVAIDRWCLRQRTGSHHVGLLGR